MNICNFMGNLVRDPELKYVGPNNKAVMNVAIAVNRKYKSRGTNGSPQTSQETAFLDCEAWDTGAEHFTRWFKKGDPVIVHCEVKQETWENDGQKRSKLKFRINQFEFIPGYNYEPNSDESGDTDTSTGDGAGFDDGSDDIPF